MTAVEWLVENIREKGLVASLWNEKVFEQAKEMEKREKLKRQLFMGKVSEIIGFEKTLELWKETLNEIK